LIPLKLQSSITTESTMKTPALSQIDTGPIVALRIARDQHQKWAVGGWAQIKPPFLTCQEVIPVIGPPSFRP